MEAVIFDSFNIAGRVAIDYGATGVVVCFEAANPKEAPDSGVDVLIIRPDGWMVRVPVGESKKWRNPVTAFIPKLTKQDVPVGPKLRWGSDFWPDVRENQSKTTPLAHA